MDDRQFRQLLNHFDLSWKGYRKVRKGVKKRIRRHMSDLRCPNPAAYLTVLEGNREARQDFELLMTVSITRFFRDREFWTTLEDDLLPELIEAHPQKIRVWSAGCACGDEVYSFKIVWDRLGERFDDLPHLDVLATDIHPVYLDRARSGIYTSGSLKELRSELQARYFTRIPGKRRYSIRASLGEGVVWMRHHLLSQPPGSGFNIVFLRNNVLTYYDEKTKKRAFENVLSSLAPGGVLVVGCHEELPYETADLTRMKPHRFVFRRRP